MKTMSCIIYLLLDALPLLFLGPGLFRVWLSLMFHSHGFSTKKLELNTSLKNLACPSLSTPTVQTKGTRLFRSLATSILRLLLLWPCLTSPSAYVSALCCRQSSRDCSSCPASPQCSSSYVWTPWCHWCNQSSKVSCQNFRHLRCTRNADCGRRICRRI